jgi:cation-transporting ATPase 13A3/4/5
MYFTYELIYVRFTPWVDDPEDDYDYQSYENSAVFYSSAYQYIILAIIFSKGKPYRQPIYSNSKYESTHEQTVHRVITYLMI